MLVVLLLEQFRLLFGCQRPHCHAEQVIVVCVFRVLLNIAVDVRIVGGSALFFFFGLKRNLETNDYIKFFFLIFIKNDCTKSTNRKILAQLKIICYLSGLPPLDGVGVKPFGNQLCHHGLLLLVLDRQSTVALLKNESTQNILKT